MSPAASDEHASVLSRAAALREAFDRSFSEPLPTDPPPAENLLAMSLDGDAYALRLTEIAGLFADRKITPVPGLAAARLGIAGFRGAIVPVYDLRVLLGHRGAEATRWLVLAAQAPVALAFTAPEGQLRIAPDAIVAPSDGSTRRHIREYARTPSLTRPIIDLSSVLHELKRQATDNAGGL